MPSTENGCLPDRMKCTKQTISGWQRFLQFFQAYTKCRIAIPTRKCIRCCVLPSTNYLDQELDEPALNFIFLIFVSMIYIIYESNRFLVRNQRIVYVKQILSSLSDAFSDNVCLFSRRPMMSFSSHQCLPFYAGKATIVTFEVLA